MKKSHTLYGTTKVTGGSAYKYEEITHTLLGDTSQRSQHLTETHMTSSQTPYGIEMSASDGKVIATKLLTNWENKSQCSQRLREAHLSKSHTRCGKAKVSEGSTLD